MGGYRAPYFLFLHCLVSSLFVRLLHFPKEHTGAAGYQPVWPRLPGGLRQRRQRKDQETCPYPNVMLPAWAGWKGLRRWLPGVWSC